MSRFLAMRELFFSNDVGCHERKTREAFRMKVLLASVGLLLAFGLFASITLSGL